MISVHELKFAQYLVYMYIVFRVLRYQQRDIGKETNLLQVEPKFLRNMKFARKHNLPGKKQREIAAARAKKRDVLMAEPSK